MSTNNFGKEKCTNNYEGNYKNKNIIQIAAYLRI